MSHSKYTPLTAEEQDVLGRMVEGRDLYVEVVDWGFHPNPQITVGDKRMQIRFPMEFTRPEGFYIPVRQFHLQLKMRDGSVVADTVESTVYNYKPLQITAGIQMDLVWELSLDKVSDEAKKRILPGLKGKRVGSIKGNKFINGDES